MVVTLPFARLLLGETITPIKLAGVVIGSVGLLLVCKPDLFLMNEEESPLANHVTYNTSAFPELNGSSHANLNITLKDQSPKTSFVIGYILSATAAFLTVFQLLIHKSKILHISVLILLFWLSLFGSLIFLMLSLIFEDIVFPTDITSWLLLLGNSGGSTFYFFIGMLGQQYASAVIIQLAFSTQVLLSFLGQYLILQHIFPSDKSWIEIMGAILSSIAVTMVPAIQLLKVKFKK